MVYQLNKLSNCLCGTGIEYDLCCGLFHSGSELPSTAKALMRSRFTAYALGNANYLLETWDAATRPGVDKIDFSKEKLDWHSLEIVDVKKGGAMDTKGIVEFKAYYNENNEACLLHEVSRFIKANGRWYYSSGIVKSVGKIIQSVNQGKNAPCSCGSGKKFKRCCGA